jgi:hypothetical protein
MYINKKTYLLLVAIIIFNILIYATGHQGDLNYYINESDESIRNSIMSIALKPLTYFNKNVFFIASTWSIFVGLLFYYKKKFIPKIFFIYAIILSPFIFFPSKDSLAVIFSLIGIVLLSKNIIINLLIVILIVAVRPFYALAFLITLGHVFFKTKIEKIFAILLLLVITTYTYFVLGLNIDDIISNFFSYSFGYFYAAEYAGTTDWKFIEFAQGIGSSSELFVSMILRAIFPVWMISIHSLTSKLYFVIYIFVLIVTFKVILNKVNLKNKVKEMIIIFLAAMILMLPFLVTNSGSSIRYISSLPFILYFIAILIEKYNNQNV